MTCHGTVCGNDPDIIVQVGRKLQGYCDAIGELKVHYSNNCNKARTVTRFVSKNG